MTAATQATLEISSTFDAEQLDALLRKLALLRAEMTPAVANTMRDADSDVLVEDVPGLSIALRQGGGFRLWLRHRGFGWLAYQLDNRTAVGLAKFIDSRAGPAIDLIGDGNGQRH